MSGLKAATRAVFGEEVAGAIYGKEVCDISEGPKGHNFMGKGEQTLLAAMTAFNDLKKIDDFSNIRKPKHSGRIILASRIYNTLKACVAEINSDSMNEKLKRFKEHYAQEIKEISSASDRNHHQRVAGRRGGPGFDHR